MRQFRHVSAKTIQNSRSRAPELRTADRAFQRVELLAEREVLEDQFVMSAAGQGQRSRHQHDCFEHASSCPAGSAKINRHTGPDAVLARDVVPWRL